MAITDFTDEALQEALTSRWPGVRNAAPHLLKLDTPERRQRADHEAHILSNLLGFIYSQAVSDAVFSLLKNISDGKEDQELYGEKQCRLDLEHQRALREQREAHDRIAFEAYQARMAKGVN